MLKQRLLRGGHLQLELEQGDRQLRAIGWGWQGDGPLPDLVDVSYRLRLDRWQGQGRRPAVGVGEVVLQRHQRRYWCRRERNDVVVRNAEGDEIRSADADNHPYVQSLLQEAATALGLVA